MLTDRPIVKFLVIFPATSADTYGRTLTANLIVQHTDRSNKTRFPVYRAFLHLDKDTECTQDSDLASKIY